MEYDLLIARFAISSLILFGAIVSQADESRPAATLKANLSGADRDPILTIRLQNTGNMSLVIDKELAFLPDIILTDKNHRAIPLNESRVVEKASASELGNRLIKLLPGEQITRQAKLRQGFRRFVTGVGLPASTSGGTPPKITAYEAMCQIPLGVMPFQIEVSYNPSYSFEDGFSKYMEGIDATQLYRGPLHVSVPYTFDSK